MIVIALLLILNGVVAADELNDVRSGMSIEDATRVAIRCIQAASRMQTRDIRLQDTLSFVGINDEMRVDALKRHLVRNPNIGVSSITATIDGEELNFLIVNSSLSGIETKWTVAKLAQTIVEKSGVPRLTFGRAANIVARCRGVKDEVSPPPTSNVAKDDAAIMSLGLDNFAGCLASRDGIGAAGYSDASGGEHRYAIQKDPILVGMLGGWTFAQLIEHIARHAR